MNVAPDAEEFKCKIAAAAADYVARKWNPVALHYKQKNPASGKGWQHIRIDADNVARHFNSKLRNIGLQMGPPSGGLADVDLDCAEARVIAPYVLAKTKSRFGRNSSRDSHWLYVTNAPPDAGADIQFLDPVQKKMLLELRLGAGGGAQSMAPPSIWTNKEDITVPPETVSWEEDDEPARVEYADLLQRTRRIAALTLLARHWPENGSKTRHQTALVVGSFLARAGWNEPAIEAGMQAIMAATGDTEPRDRRRAAKDALRGFKDGKRVPGFPKLVECFGREVAEKVAKWVGYESEAPNQEPGEAGELPELAINEADPTATAKELAALIAKRDDVLFNGYAPVRVAVEADELPRALELITEAVRVYAHELCQPVKLRKTKNKIEHIPVPLSKDIAQLYLNGLEGKWGLRSFRGITTAPILRDDGDIRIARGYDRETGLWCHNIPDLAIPNRPTEAEARAALRNLREFFQTFPYADGERRADDRLGIEITDFSKKVGLDESTLLTALLTAVCRQSRRDPPCSSTTSTPKN